jgi:hypothetical protein
MLELVLVPRAGECRNRCTTILQDRDWRVVDEEE